MRDLQQMKMQVFSISLVVALGTAILIGFTSTFDSLQKAQLTFYQKANYADIFVLLKRAPLYALQEIIDDVDILEVEPRLEYDGLLSVEGFSEIASAHLISIPDGNQPKISKLHLKMGHLPTSFNLNEAVISEGFFNAHKLSLGESVEVNLNGKKIKLKIVGVGVSPEYIMALPPGNPMPDDFHFAIIWVQQSLLEMRFDMKGAFNFLVLNISKNSTESEIIPVLEKKLNKFGALNIYSRKQQVSNVYVNEELKQLQVQATILPIIFFLVAAFVLNVVVARLVQMQRSEIATLKALGIKDLIVSNYYFILGAVIILLGNIMGIILGVWIGKMMTALYTYFYHFPVLLYELNINRVIFSFITILIVTIISLIGALRRIFSLSPAEAMRPANPSVYHAFKIEKSLWFQSFDPKTKMMIRGILNQPVKSIMGVFGFSFTIVLIISGLFWQDSMDYLVYAQYGLAQRETGQIQLTNNSSPYATSEIRRIDGVTEAEGYLVLPVEVVFEKNKQKTSIRAFPDEARLSSLIDSELNLIPIPQGAVYISKILAKQLKAKEGDSLEVRFLEGKREIINFKINKIVDSFLSNEIITSRKVISSILKQDDLINMILFRSLGRESLLYNQLKKKPHILSVSFKDSSLRTFQETSAKYLLVFAFILSVFAGVIGFGVAYNNLQIALSERDWELASLQVLGFKSLEVFKVLISEIIILIILSIPIGWGGGWLLSKWMLQKMLMESLQIPFVMNPKTFVFSALILIISTFLGALFVYIKVKKMDLIATLKSRG